MCPQRAYSRPRAAGMWSLATACRAGRPALPESSTLSVGLRSRPLSRDPGQSVAPKFRWLGARYAVLLRHNKEGHALNTHTVALLLQLNHGVEALELAERTRDALGLKAGLGRQAFEDAGVTDVDRLLEIGSEQTVHEGILQPLPARLPNGAVGEPRVGRRLHAVKGKGNPELLAGFDHVAVEFGAARRTEFAGAVSLPLDPLRGHVGIELEGPPGQARRGRHVRGGKRRLEPALADIAPGTDHVRIDGDGEGVGHGHEGKQS